MKPLVFAGSVLFSCLVWGVIISVISWALGCTGEISGGGPRATVDAGPIECKDARIVCEWSDPSSKTGWHCYYRYFCDEDGGV